MAFPGTPILDTFNRANGSLGANWTSPVEPGHSTPTILSNVAIGVTGAFNSAYWDSDQFSLNQEMYGSWTLTSGSSLGFYTRLTNPNSGNMNFYGGVWDPSSGFNIYRIIGGISSGSILSVPGLLVVNGWKTGLSINNIGNNIVIDYWSDKGSGWVKDGIFTDSGAVSGHPEVAGAGYIGFVLWGSGATDRSMDNFGGGNSSLSSDTPPIFFGRGAC